MEIKGDQVIFSTGRVLTANGGVIGLGSSAQCALEGWDGQLEPDPFYDEEALSESERHELADYMIDLWTKYKSTIIKKGN